MSVFLRNMEPLMDHYHEINSTIILHLQLIQEGKLAFAVKSMCTSTGLPL